MKSSEGAPQKNNEVVLERRFWWEDTTITDSSFKAYKELLNISEEKLKKKVILNLGSGMRQKFEEEARSKGIEIISLSPDLSKRKYRESINPEALERFLDSENRSVSGIGQELPFKDASFDFILSLYSVPYYLDRPVQKDELSLILEEIVRVLKIGGEARIYPIEKSMLDEVRDALQIFDEREVVVRFEESQSQDDLEEENLILVIHKQ